MANTPGRLVLLAKDAKLVLLSPRPWKAMRMAVVDSGGEGKCRVWGRVVSRAVKSPALGTRGGIVEDVLCCLDGVKVVLRGVSEIWRR